MIRILFSQKQKNWFDFLLAMTEKEIKARYKHALLGFLWVILNPLLQMIVIGIVFQFFIPVKVDNYFLFLFAGLLPWNFFAYSVTKTTPSIVFERALIQKANFPRESIVLSIVLSNAFHFLVSLGLFLIVLGVVTIVQAKLVVELMSLYKIGILCGVLIWIGILTSALSLLFSALNVRFRDINFIVQALMPLWFYATPIVYSLSLLPSFLHSLVYLNPMTAVVEAFHWVLLGYVPANLHLWWISLMTTVVVVILGWWTFKSESPFFDDWL